MISNNYEEFEQLRQAADDIAEEFFPFDGDSRHNALTEAIEKLLMRQANLNGKRLLELDSDLAFLRSRNVELLDSNVELRKRLVKTKRQLEECESSNLIAQLRECNAMLEKRNSEIHKYQKAINRAAGKYANADACIRDAALQLSMFINQCGGSIRQVEAILNGYITNGRYAKDA